MSLFQYPGVPPGTLYVIGTNDSVDADGRELASLQLPSEFDSLAIGTGEQRKVSLPVMPAGRWVTNIGTRVSMDRPTSSPANPALLVEYSTTAPAFTSLYAAKVNLATDPFDPGTPISDPAGRSGWLFVSGGPPPAAWVDDPSFPANLRIDVQVYNAQVSFAGLYFAAQNVGLNPPLRQFPRDDALGGQQRQFGSRSVQSSTRSGWSGAYR